METILLSFVVEGDVPSVAQAVGQVVQGIARTQFNHYAYIDKKEERYYLVTSDRVVSREALCVAIANVSESLFRGVADSFAWKHDGVPLWARRPAVFPLPGLALRKLGSADSSAPGGCQVEIECGEGLGKFSVYVGGTLGVGRSRWDGICTGQVADATYENGILVATMRFRRSDSRSFLVEDERWIEQNFGKLVTVVLARIRGCRRRWRLDYSLDHIPLIPFHTADDMTVAVANAKSTSTATIANLERDLMGRSTMVDMEWSQPDLFVL